MNAKKKKKKHKDDKNIKQIYDAYLLEKQTHFRKVIALNQEEEQKKLYEKWRQFTKLRKMKIGRTGFSRQRRISI